MDSWTSSLTMLIKVKLWADRIRALFGILVGFASAVSIWTSWTVRIMALFGTLVGFATAVSIWAGWKIDVLKAAPRTLTQQQRTTLISLLRVGPKGPITIQPLAGDSEAVAFATQIGDTFQAAGWDPQTRYVPMLPAGAQGLVLSNHGEPLPPYATMLKNAFEQIGFPVSVSDEPIPGRTVILFVGQKP